MALRDVQNYYHVILKQYVDTKDDLADFEEALQNGYITEDKLESVKDDLNRIKENLDRIQYIMYLFAIPKRKEKQKKFKQTYSKIENHLIDCKADLNSIKDENEFVLAHLNAELKKLEKQEN